MIKTYKLLYLVSNVVRETILPRKLKNTKYPIKYKYWKWQTFKTPVFTVEIEVYIIDIYFIIDMHSAIYYIYSGVHVQSLNFSNKYKYITIIETS